jgi:hypothetical protein
MGEYTHNPITGLGFNDGASEGDGAAWEGGHKDMEGLKARSRHRVVGYGERTAPFDAHAVWSRRCCESEGRAGRATWDGRADTAMYGNVWWGDSVEVE